MLRVRPLATMVTNIFGCDEAKECGEAWGTDSRFCRIFKERLKKQDREGEKEIK